MSRGAFTFYSARCDAVVSDAVVAGDEAETHNKYSADAVSWRAIRVDSRH